MKTWLPIATIPKTGLTVLYTPEDSEIWKEKLEETALECIFVKPLEAEITLQVEDTGIMVSGSFSAEITMPCSFCLERASLAVGHIFYDCIQIEPDYIIEEGNYVRESKKGLEINPSEIIFEEFLMDTTVSIECKKGCLGLCPLCGQNKNLASCSCDNEKKDPRLEKLASFIVEKKQD